MNEDPAKGMKWDKNGLLPCVLQNAATGEVLTLAYMNAESFAETLRTGQIVFWSRSRKELWRKGETSGNTMRVAELRLDCDGDALVARVIPAGPACHTGENDCFFTTIHRSEAVLAEAAKPEQQVGFGARLGELMEQVRTLLQTRKQEMPEGSYSTYLFKAGIDKILKKLGEEATETIIAAKGEDKAALVGEMCDLVYHLMVLMVQREISLEDLRRVMEERHHKKGGSPTTGRLTQKEVAARMAEEHEPELKISRPEGCLALEERLLRQIDAAIKRDVTRALEVMYRAHAGQTRDEGTPYATHPLEVALLAVEECKMRGREEVISALLHDVLEDHMPTTPKDIEDRFGPVVAEAAVTLTKMYKRDGTPKELGLRRYYEGLRGAPSWLRAVKICDRVHNLRSLPKSGKGADHIAQYKKATRENLLPLCATSTDPRLLKAAELLLLELHRK